MGNDLTKPESRTERYLAKIAEQNDDTTGLDMPQTRTERYLAKIAGLTSTAPTEQQNRVERYLKIIAENGGGQANLESKSITITENGTTQILPDSEYDGLSDVTINTDVPVGTDTSDADATASNILINKTAYVRGDKLTGTMPNRGAVTGTISTKSQVYSIAEGYHNGSGKVSIATTEQNKLIPENIKDGVTILGVTGTYGREVLPTGYTKLEYIQSSGTQYINTGLNSGNTLRMVVKMLSTDRNAGYFGARVDSYNKAFTFFSLTQGPITADYYNQRYTRSIYPPEGDYTVDINGLSMYVTISGAISDSFSLANGDFSTGYPVFLFAINNAGSVMIPSDMRLYYCKMYANGSMARNFYPCRRNSDSAVGLYDLQTAKFYANAGTGSFIAGPLAVSNTVSLMDSEISNTNFRVNEISIAASTIAATI